MSLKRFLTFLIAIIFSSSLPAVNQKEMAKRRMGPKEVSPVFHKGVKYAVPHLIEIDKDQRGGFIEAWDFKTNQRLWVLKVYDVNYDPNLEADVQWIFITSMELRGDKLLVTNEREEKFFVDLKTRKVTGKKWWRFWK